MLYPHYKQEIPRLGILTLARVSMTSFPNPSPPLILPNPKVCSIKLRISSTLIPTYLSSSSPLRNLSHNNSSMPILDPPTDFRTPSLFLVPDEAHADAPG